MLCESPAEQDRAQEQASSRRPRVLLMAYACSPEHGSEPGVGWNRAIQTARYCDTWVICEERRYGPLVQNYLDRHGPIPGLHFHFVRKSRRVRWLERIPGMDYRAYRNWHWDAYQLARQLHQQIPFDLVQQVTYCGYRVPGYLWKLGVPFVWGPIGGTQNYPWRFLTIADLSGAIRECARSFLNHLQLRFSPTVRQATRKAAVVLAANSTVQRDFEKAHGIRPELLLETGLNQVAEAPPQRRQDSSLRLLWSGDFSTWKALPVLLRAMSQIPREIPWRLRILGKGRLERAWKRLGERLNLNDRIEWMGWIPLQEALQQYSWADALAFTSLRDTSGNVVLEALGAGVPVLCHDHQGARDIVTSECGIRIPVTTPRETIGRWSEAIVSLWESPEQRRRLAHGALERAREYLWTRQGERMARVYEQVLGRPLEALRQQADASAEMALP